MRLSYGGKSSADWCGCPEEVLKSTLGHRRSVPVDASHFPPRTVPVDASLPVGGCWADATARQVSGAGTSGVLSRVADSRDGRGKARRQVGTHVRLRPTRPYSKPSCTYFPHGLYSTIQYCTSQSIEYCSASFQTSMAALFFVAFRSCSFT
jgi:hypothetical protein